MARVPVLTTNLSANKLFLLAVIGGTICIFVGSYFKLNILTLAGPLTVMGFYTWALYSDQVTAISTEQKADSVYYLGFIFTLIAMTISLVILANESNAELAFRPIVVNFGLALSTTIVGLVVRIFWLQLSAQTLDDAELSMRDKIIRRTHELQEQSERIVASMNGLSSQMTAVAEPLRTYFKKLSDSFEISESINKNLSELRSNTRKAGDDLVGLSETISALSPEMQKLNEKVASAVEVPLTITEDLAAIEVSSQKVSKGFDTLSTSTLELSPKLPQFAEVILAAGNKLSESVMDMERKIAHAEELSDKSNKAVIESLEENQNAISDIRKSMNERLSALADLNTQTKSSLKNSIDSTLVQSEKMLADLQLKVVKNTDEIVNLQKQAAQEFLSSTKEIIRHSKETEESLSEKAKRMARSTRRFFKDS